MATTNDKGSRPLSRVSDQTMLWLSFMLELIHNIKLLDYVIATAGQCHVSQTISLQLVLDYLMAIAKLYHGTYVVGR